MEIKQNDLEYLKDMVERGQLTVEQANIKKIKMQRVMLVVGRLPASLRKTLNAAVKRGELGHMLKRGKQPEAYYHPIFEYLARSERKKYEESVNKALTKVACASLD